VGPEPILVALVFIAGTPEAGTKAAEAAAKNYRVEEYTQELESTMADSLSEIAHRIRGSVDWDALDRKALRILKWEFP
jgi:hypothetical protein